MALAVKAAERSTCSRLHVGAVVVQDRQVLSTGYNGAPSGIAHCEHSDDTPCSISVHAEANAVLFAPTLVPCFIREMYVTHAPCFHCAKLIINAGIDRVVYKDLYRSPDGLNLLLEGGVLHERLEG